MPRPGSIPGRDHEYLTVPGMPWLNDALGRGFVRGGVYLVAGEPGVGKSTLMLQVCGELARRGTEVLYITSEQSLIDLEAVLQRLFAPRGDRLPAGLCRNFHLEDRVRDVDDLPRFLARRVMPRGQEYSGVEALVYDSIQGRGLAPGATQKYQALYEFMETAKAHGLVSIVLGHINKAGQIAGPRTLEHNVDCVLYLRKAFGVRPLFVPKNRFGPAWLDPIALTMDGAGRLAKSPQATAQSACVFGYAGSSNELAEVQASVGLARYGSNPRLDAPSLPRPKMQQLVKVLGGLRGVDLSELSYEVNVYIPGSRDYGHELDLPLAIALLASYLQQPVPVGALFVGELDLMRRVRPPRAEYVEGPSRLLQGRRRGNIRRVYVSERVAGRLAERRPSMPSERVDGEVEVRGVADLEAVLRELWPAVFKGPAA